MQGGGMAQGPKDGGAGMPGGGAAGSGAPGALGAGAGGRKIYECFLEGAISAGDRHEALLDRLVGLCGPAGGAIRTTSSSATSPHLSAAAADSNFEDDDEYAEGDYVAPPVVLHHRELLFKAPPPPVSTITTQTQTVGAAAAAALGVPINPAPTFNELRVRCRLVPSKQGPPVPPPSGAWSVHYISVPLMREKMAANVRNVTDVEVSDNIIDFLHLMGYQFQFEFIREGFVFQTQRKITISVTQIKKIVDRSDLSAAEPLVAGTWFVELSARTDDSNLIPSVAEEINSFADHLMPLVDVKRVDYRRFFATSLAPDAKRPPGPPGQPQRVKAPAGGFPPAAGAGRGAVAGQTPQQQQQPGKTNPSWITL